VVITMRRAVDVVAAVAAIAVACGLGAFYYLQHQDDLQIKEVAGGLRRFEQVLVFKGASKESEVSERGWPLTVDPHWFGAGPPQNLLVTPDRPWLEVATPEQATMSDPPLRVAIGTQVSAFWYNPYKGIVRARVPIAISDRRALELYNRVNGTNLDNLYCADAAQTLPPVSAMPAASPTGPSGPGRLPVPAPASDLDPTKPRTADATTHP
jgi:hypothetical protein